MPTAHVDKPGAIEADCQTDNTDRGPHKNIGIICNQSTTTRRRKKDKTNKRCKLCGQFHRNPDFFWDLEKNANNRPTGWVTKQTK